MEFKAPEPLKKEHDELHAELAKMTNVGGKISAAAKAAASARRSAMRHTLAVVEARSHSYRRDWGPDFSADYLHARATNAGEMMAAERDQTWGTCDEDKWALTHKEAGQGGVMIRYRNIVAAAVLAVALLGLLPVTAFGQESAAGWYRFEKTGNGPNQDEQSKNGLSACVRQRHIADDVYAIRVVDVPENKGKTFDDLCKHIGLACIEVLDRQCNLKTCGEEPDPKYSGAGPDGSRIAHCGQRPDVK